MPSIATINYTLPPRGYFWSWSDDCSVEWEDGSTIAVFEEIEAILSELAPRGLPPLGSIVLLMAACAENWAGRWEQTRKVAAASTGLSEPLRTTERLLLPVGAGLKAVNGLPLDLRRGVRARINLIAAVFDSVFNRLPEQVSSQIVSEVKREGLRFRRHEKPDLGIHTRLLRDLSALEAAFRQLNLNQLEQLIRAGIDAQTVHEADVSLLSLFKDTEVSRLPLLDQLAKQSDTQLSSVAALARQVVAMITVPRLSGKIQELPIGGISDITNRGDFTQLLTAELAWDEEMFSARLAHAEALFYRREFPPNAPQVVRSILLDHGIRLWGLPRLYALAVALGLASQASTRAMAAEIWRREEDEFMRLPLASVADVQAHLAELSPSVNPVEALRSWVPDPDKSRQDDVFLITHSDTLRSPEVVIALQSLIERAAGSIRLFSLGLDRDGGLEFTQHSTASQRVLAKCRIDLDSLLPAPPKPQSSPEVPPASRRLWELAPNVARLRFYREWPLPLKYRAAPRFGQDYNTAWHGCTVGVDMERRLMAWSDVSQPATELSYGLPKAAGYWVNPNTEADLFVLCSGAEVGDRVKLVRQRQAAEPPEVIELRSKHSFPRSGTFSNGVAILHYHLEAEAFSLTTGLRVAEIKFNSPEDSSAVVYDGEELRIESREPKRLYTRKLLEVDKRPQSLVIPPPPLVVGLIDDKLALGWEHEARVWSAAGKRFNTIKRRGPLKAAIPFTKVGGPMVSEPEVPQFWHARFCDTEFYYDQRGIFHIATPEAHVALPVDAGFSEEVWADPPKSGRKTIEETANQLLVFGAIK